MSLNSPDKKGTSFKIWYLCAASCYQEFIALPQSCRSKLSVSVQDASSRPTTDSARSDESGKSSRITRSDLKTFLKPSGFTGVFPNACIFCNQSRKKVKQKEQALMRAETVKFENSIQKYVLEHDKALKTRLQSVNLRVKLLNIMPIAGSGIRQKLKDCGIPVKIDNLLKGQVVLMVFHTVALSRRTHSRLFFSLYRT